MNNYNIVIPARYKSTRLPGKILMDINGKTMLERVWDKARTSSAEKIVIAADDLTVKYTAEAFGATVVMTSQDHQCGADRIAECVTILEWDLNTVVVNLQADEPLMPKECIDQVAANLIEKKSSAASLYTTMFDKPADHNVVKVVVNNAHNAMYFSRSQIPFGLPIVWKRHLGLYAYTVQTLHKFSSYYRSSLEELENLEQLRLLENGHIISMAEAVREIPPGVDTLKDLELVREIIK